MKLDGRFEPHLRHLRDATMASFRPKADIHLCGLRRLQLAA